MKRTKSILKKSHPTPRERNDEQVHRRVWSSPINQFANYFTKRWLTREVKVLAEREVGQVADAVTRGSAAAKAKEHQD